MFKKKLIEFSAPNSDWFLPPLPAKKIVPSWFKEIPNYQGQIKNFLRPTIKKCVPVLDSLTSGYIIQNPADVVFWEEAGDVRWEYKDQIKDKVGNMNIGINTHDSEQISKNFIRDNEYKGVFKFLNPWTITTPKGYSCLFTNPLNRQDNSIRIIDGIVDTDTYPLEVNFPFFLKIMKDKTFVLEKGYPVALVFPFLRDDWKMKVTKPSEKKVKENNKKFFKLFSHLKDSYKKVYWRTKNYD